MGWPPVQTAFGQKHQRAVSFWDHDPIAIIKSDAIMNQVHHCKCVGEFGKQHSKLLSAGVPLQTQTQAPATPSGSKSPDQTSPTRWHCVQGFKLTAMVVALPKYNLRQQTPQGVCHVLQQTTDH